MTDNITDLSYYPTNQSTVDSLSSISTDHAFPIGCAINTKVLFVRVIYFYATMSFNFRLNLNKPFVLVRDLILLELGDRMVADRDRSRGLHTEKCRLPACLRPHLNDRFVVRDIYSGVLSDPTMKGICARQ